ERRTTNQLVSAGTVVFALATVALAAVHSFSVLAVALAGGGVAWIAVLSNLNVSAQTVTPSWVRARVMAVYLLVFMGGLAGGSAVWGFVAARAGVSVALLFAAIGLVIGPLMTSRFRLIGNDSSSLAPSQWPEPVMMIDAEASQGPAITVVEYRIDPNTAQD